MEMAEIRQTIDRIGWINDANQRQLDRLLGRSTGDDAPLAKVLEFRRRD